jgi:cell division protein FtsQ
MKKKILKNMKRRSVLKNQSVKKKGKRNFLASFSIIPRVGVGLLRVVFMFTVIAFVSVIFLSVYHFLLTSPYLQLEQVEVEGVDRELRNELIDMCGLNSDLSLLALNLNELKQKMEEHAWVRSVRLERQFPHTLIVHVEKEQPWALLLTDKLYHVNRWGKIVREVCDEDRMDLPVITGISNEGPETQMQLDRAVHIMRTFESEEGLWSLSELSEIHMKKEGGVSIYFNHLAAEIKLMGSQPSTAGPEGSRLKDLPSKIDGLKRIAEHLRHSGRINQINGIDLNYVDQAVVSFRKG